MEDRRLSEAQLAVTAAAVSGDAGRLYHLVAGLLDEGTPFDTLLFDLLMPAEKDVGLRWQSGDYLISEEHAATATIETVISLLAGSFDQPDSGQHIVVANAEGDTHSLPARAVAAHLLFLGYRTTFLGANVLATDLREYLATEEPDALVLACAMTNHLLGARAAIREAHGVETPVIAGGNAFGPTGSWAIALGADAWVARARDVAETLETWTPDPAESETRALDPSPELERLIDQRAAITARAIDELERLLEESPEARLRDELTILLGAVEAAMLVGDEQVITNTLDWQRATLTAHGYGNPGHLADALVVSIGSVSTIAAESLRASTARLEFS